VHLTFIFQSAGGGVVEDGKINEQVNVAHLEIAYKRTVTPDLTEIC
jgi:hypothetical protein